MLSGKIKNSGDFIITEKTKELIKMIHPQCQIDEYNRVYDMSKWLDDINQHDIAVVAGGPGLLSGETRLLNIDNVEKITIPIFALGLGWFGEDTIPDILYQYELQGENLSLFQRIVSDTKIIGCRDMISLNVLRNSGLEGGVLTGCPVWFDTDKIQQFMLNQKLSGKIGKVCISDPANPIYLDELVEVVEYVRKYVVPEKIQVLFHRGIMPEHTKVIEFLTKENVEYVDISNDFQGFRQYDSAQLHIGFRVHAHLYNLSKRNCSVLISEDGRGVATNETLGLPVIKAYSIRETAQNTLIKNYNEYMKYQIDDVLKNMITTNYYELERSFETMHHYYGVMKQHIKSMKNFV